MRIFTQQALPDWLKQWSKIHHWQIGTATEVRNDIHLIYSEGLQLTWPTKRIKPVKVELAAPRFSGKDLLARAIGKDLRIVDGTAGLGQDTAHLLQLGLEVTAVERNPVLWALLRDGQERLKQTHPELAARLELKFADAREFLPQQPKAKYTLFLDPMFPEKKKNALPSGPMQMLRQILQGEPADFMGLFQLGLAHAQRVVVKRPLRFPLEEVKPHFVFKGKTIRYEVWSCTHF